MGIKVIDNFLPEKEFQHIYDVMSSDNFAWYLSSGVVTPGDGRRQLFHNIYEGTYYRGEFESHVVMTIATALNPSHSIYPTRVKANLQLKTPDILQHTYHTDLDNVTGIEQAKTGILYMNTNNGYTVFEDGKKIESVRNRYVEFPAWYKHAGTTNTDTDFRMVINFNYIDEAYKNE